MLGAEPRCIVDLATISPARRGLALNDIIDRMTAPIGIMAIDMKPESVFVALDRLEEKQVPVTLDADLEFRSGYGQIGEVTLQPESVAVRCAVSLLPEIRSWPTKHTTFSDLKAPVEIDVPLKDSASSYLALTPASVRVSINVQQLAEKTIAGLPVEVRDAPRNKEVILIPPRIDVVVRGGVLQLATLANDSFRASVDYRSIITDTTGYVDPVVTSPAGVQMVQVKPERMQFVIRTRL
jgi:hypothetical protein